MVDAQLMNLSLQHKQLIYWAPLKHNSAKTSIKH